jgi:hypothetical protein
LGVVVIRPVRIALKTLKSIKVWVAPRGSSRHPIKVAACFLFVCKHQGARFLPLRLHFT